MPADPSGKTRPPRKWLYSVRQNMLPPGATSPVPAGDDIEWWLNRMDEEGWEYVGPAVRSWNQPETIFTWFVFRRPHP